MNIVSEIESVGGEILKAGFQAATGVTAPGAPAATSAVTTIAGLKITFSQLVTAAKVFEGASIGTALKKVLTDLGDVDNDLDVTLKVATALADLGVPYANDAVLALNVLKFGYDFLHANGGFQDQPPLTPPHAPPPVTSADWSHGFDGFPKGF